jgi:hypothetical protein
LEGFLEEIVKANLLEVCTRPSPWRHPVARRAKRRLELVSMWLTERNKLALRPEHRNSSCRSPMTGRVPAPAIFSNRRGTECRRRASEALQAARSLPRHIWEIGGLPECVREGRALPGGIFAVGGAWKSNLLGRPSGYSTMYALHYELAP